MVPHRRIRGTSHRGHETHYLEEAEELCDRVAIMAAADHRARRATGARRPVISRGFRRTVERRELDDVSSTDRHDLRERMDDALRRPVGTFVASAKMFVATRRGLFIPSAPSSSHLRVLNFEGSTSIDRIVDEADNESSAP